MTSTTLKEIADTFGLPSAPKSEVIAKTRVQQWMTSEDLEVLGALHAFLSKGKNLDRVELSFSRDELAALAMRYFERCLRENNEGDWAHSRYGAARDVAAWFAALWKRGADEHALMREIKAWLARVYKGADPDLKRAIVDGALEHMFEAKAIRDFFAEWRADPELAVAFAEAVEWTERKP